MGLPSYSSAQDVAVPAQFLTIQQGIDAVGPGGTVFVSPGTYSESLLIDPAGVTGTLHGEPSMTIEATAAGVVVSWVPGTHAQPGVVTVAGTVQDYNLAAVGTANLTVRGIEFDGMDDITAGQNSSAILYKDASGLVENCTLHGYRQSATSGAQNGFGISAQGISTVLQVNNTAFFALQKGHVTVNRGATVNLSGCTFTGRGVNNSIAQNAIQFGGSTTTADGKGSVIGCSFNGFWYNGGTWTATGILNYDSGPDITIDGNTFIDCQSGIFDTNNPNKVTTQITNNVFEQVSPFTHGIITQGVVIQDGNGNNDYLVYGNVFRHYAGAGLWLDTRGGTIANNWFDGDGVSRGENAHDANFSSSKNQWDNNTWSDLASNTLGPDAYRIPGFGGSIDMNPKSGGIALPYGSLNPAGSLTVISPPKLGTTLRVGLDNPLGTQAPGATGLFAISRHPQPNFPGGLSLPGWGMNGGSGELLISASGHPSIFVGTPWGGPGSPSVVSIPVPYAPILVGEVWYGQGILLDPTTPGFKRGLTGAVQLIMGF